MKTVYKDIKEFLATPVEEMMYDHYLDDKDREIIAKKYDTQDGLNMVTGNGNHAGTTNKTVIFSVPDNAPGSLYYHCGNHSYMGNKINIDGTILSSSTNKAKITLENTTDEDVIRFNTNNTERMKIENGKILPSRITNVSQKKQRELSLSIKRARNLALL